MNTETFQNVLMLVLVVTVAFYVLKKQREWHMGSSGSGSAKPSDNDTVVCVAVNNKREHRILNKPDKDKACELLGEIEARICRLVTHLKRKFPKNESVVRMSARLKHTMFNESSGSTRFETYTKNKGDEMAFCLRDKSDRLHGINTLMYVAVHELSHAMSVTYHHTTEFSKNFKELLQYAADMGIYTPIDYARNPAPYCKIMIDSNILYS